MTFFNRFALLTLVFTSALQSYSQNVGINSTGAAPDASAALDVVSTDKGILVPRMTLAQRGAIAAPATGLLIYQTDGADGFWFYDGAVWVEVQTTASDKDGIYDGDGTTPAGTDVTVTDYVNFDANTMYLDGTNNKIGIGTIAPYAKLDVIGIMNVSNNNGYAVKNNYMANGSLAIGDMSTNFGGGNAWNANTAGLLLETLDNTEIAVHDAGARIASFMYYEGASNRINVGRNMGWGAISTISLNGNVGIGIVAPTQKLDVQGGNARINNAFIGDVGFGATWAGFTNSSQSTTTGYSLLANTGGNYTLINKKNTGDGWIGFRVDNADKMVITNAGNVGIATTNPSGRLHALNADGSSMLYGTSGNLSVYNSEAFVGEVRLGAAWGRPGLYSSQQLELFSDNTGIIFGDSNIERMRMTAAGNLGIGTTGPSAKLDVVGTTELNGAVAIIDGTQGAGKVLTSDASGNASWESPSTQEAWNAVTFQNGWTNYAGWAAASYMKDSDGVVHIKGLVQSGSAGTAIFTLPAGYRPAENRMFAVIACCDGVARVDIYPSGVVYANTGTSGSYTSIDITFRP